MQQNKIHRIYQSSFYFSTIVFLSLHMQLRVTAASRVVGSSISASKSDSPRWSRASGVREGSWLWMAWTSSWPMFSLKEHSRSSCWRVPVSCLQSLQRGEGEAPILWRRSWVQSRSSNIFQRKEARSGGIPCCLQSDQDRDQSVVGLASSALHGRKSFLPLSKLISMVT